MDKMEETCVLGILDTLTFDIILLRTELINMRYISNIVPQNGCWRVSSQNHYREKFYTI